MKKLLLVLAVLTFLVSGCKTVPEKDRLIEKGTFAEKIVYLDKNLAGRAEVLELLGQPDSKQEFYSNVAIWKYTHTESPVEIVFGSEGRIMRIDVKEK